MVWFVSRSFAALYPRAGDMPGLDELGVDAFVRQLFQEGTWLFLLGVVFSALAFHITPFMTVYWPLPAFMLPKKVLDEHANRVCGSRIYILRSAMILLKNVAVMHWGAHPEVRQRLGLEPYGMDPGTFRGSHP